MIFDEIVISQFKRKQPLKESYEIVNDSSMLTCYEGLRCHSTICLDWREICDGTSNCENGEDEPNECLLLETNECKNDEYRCVHGECIPTTFLIDFSYDCMDLSDEKYFDRSVDGDPSCYLSPTLLCDFRLDGMPHFSCSDGERLSVDNWDESCNNGRDLFLRRNLFSVSSSDNNSSKNISSECWFFMLCVNSVKYTKLFDHINRRCECSSKDIQNNRFLPDRCLEYFRKYCPESFVFQTEWNSLYPFIRFLYDNTPKYEFYWWKPSHACYNHSHCPIFPLSGLPLIDGLMCIPLFEASDRVTNKFLQRVFSVCSIPYTPVLASDRRLFYCNKSIKLISKYRVKDGFSDCYRSEDEPTSWDGDMDATMMHNLNLTGRFKCNTTNQWVIRSKMEDFGSCRDKSDSLYIGGCKKGSDIGCQFLRGLYSPPVFYVFQENCNGYLKLDPRFSVMDETDETNCEEWPSIRCNGHWNLINGEDELNCPNTISSYITHTVLNCTVDEHYCADKNNGRMGCLAKERAGDGVFDCLGRTDERMISCAFRDAERPFYCYNDMVQGELCIDLSDLCNDQTSYCHDNANKLMCPWIKYSECDTKRFFACENGTCITRERQCNNVVDCQPDGEDEWFCDLSGNTQITQFSLDKIDGYPSVISARLMSSTIDFHPPTLLPVNDILFRSVNPLDNWFCNRGIIVKKNLLALNVSVHLVITVQDVNINQNVY